MSTANSYERIRGNFKHPKVLVIDDNADHLVLIKNAMHHCLPEVELVCAETPNQALTLLDDWITQEWELPKLILQDLYLPAKADGWALLAQIKSMSPVSRQIPIVILSSSNCRADIDEAYQYGGTLYMVKPFNGAGWLTQFKELRTYWWETVTLPPMQFIM